MTPREQYIKTLLFQNPDRVPFHPGGPRESTLKAWRQQGLPPNVNWLQYLCEQIGVPYDPDMSGARLDVRFAMIPEFEQKIIECHPDTHSIVVQDWKGNICEISDQYGPEYCGGKGGKTDFVTRKWIKCPVESWKDWETMKSRYNPDDPARFPADFAKQCEVLKNRRRLISVGFSGVFWQLREWMGFEGLCMALLDQPDLVRDMVRFWDDFVSAVLTRLLKHIAPDVIHISEDMAYKEKAMISPAMIREFIMPTWKRWGELAHRAGCHLYDVDSDGYVGELIPLWIESGFQVNDPVEVAAGNDLPAFRKKYGNRIAYTGGIDKRAMAKGGDVIKAEIKRLEPVIKSGGYIPSCDHGIPPDIAWPAMLEYARLLAQVTGWK